MKIEKKVAYEINKSSPKSPSQELGLDKNHKTDDDKENIGYKITLGKRGSSDDKIEVSLASRYSNSEPDMQKQSLNSTHSFSNKTTPTIDWAKQKGLYDTDEEQSVSYHANMERDLDGKVSESRKIILHQEAIDKLRDEEFLDIPKDEYMSSTALQKVRIQKFL